MRENRIMRTLLITLTVLLTVTLCVPGTAEAASSKAVKSVVLKIGDRKVSKKTYTLVKGKTASLKVSVNPSKAKKSMSFKSSNKKVATVSKKGKITAKKSGTAKITVTVKGKKGKKKTTYVKIKVTAKKSNISTTKSSHTHKWVNITETQRIYVVDSQAWDEPVYESRYVCSQCDFWTTTADTTEIGLHCAKKNHSYSLENVEINTIHHDAKGHYETKTVIIDRKCSICGILDSKL